MLRWACVAGLLALLVAYDVKGLHLTPDMQWNVLRFEESVCEGLPVAAVTARQWEDMQSDTAADLSRDLELMCAARIGPYRRGMSVAATRDVSVVPLLPLRTVTWRTGVEWLGCPEEIVQPFEAVPGRRLFRIDLAVCRPRGAATLHWAVVEVDSAGRRAPGGGGLPAGNRRGRSCLRPHDLRSFHSGGGQPA